jgi:hypothetical protein
LVTRLLASLATQSTASETLVNRVCCQFFDTIRLK